MTIFKVIVEDDQARLLKQLLEQFVFVKSIEEQSTFDAADGKPISALEQIKKIQTEIGDKNLFNDIKDPSEWQREIRKEWNRDF